MKAWIAAELRYCLCCDKISNQEFLGQQSWSRYSMSEMTVGGIFSKTVNDKRHSMLEMAVGLGRDKKRWDITPFIK